VTYVTKLQDTCTVKVHSISRKAKEIVFNKHFWKLCINFWEVVASMMWALRDFEGKGPCMEKILHIFRNLEKHILSLKGEPFRLDRDLTNVIEDAFYNRWRMVKTDLHYIGLLLNSYLLHNKELADDSDSLIACKKVLQKLCPPETYPSIVQYFLAFRHK
jgi:hypothetical protein